MGFAAGVNAGVNVGQSIKANIQREKDNERREKFDAIDLQVKQTLLDKSKLELARLSKRGAGDPYDQYMGIANRYSDDESKAQDALALAEASGDPQQMANAQRRLQVVQMVGQQMMKGYSASMKTPTKKISKKLDDGTTETYEVPFDPATEVQQAKTRDLTRDTSRKLFPDMDDERLLEIENTPGFQSALAQSPEFQAELAKVRVANGGKLSFHAPVAAPLSPQAVQPVTQMAPVAQPSEQDQQALAWAQANPRDPRAAKILKKLGAR